MLTTETPATSEFLHFFLKTEVLRHNKRWACARAIECGVTGLISGYAEDAENLKVTLSTWHESIVCFPRQTL